MINKKALYILFGGILVFTFVYLYYVKQQRQEAIARYLPDPQKGDIYKIKQEGAVFYLQVKTVAGGSVFFYHGAISAYAASDILLKHFDSTDVIHYDKSELQAIRNGRWDDEEHGHTSLVDITRPVKN
ncbi:MAG TPA: hypothetical protein VGM41_09085 [Chitinophagaceae bacterium]